MCRHPHSPPPQVRPASLLCPKCGPRPNRAPRLTVRRIPRTPAERRAEQKRYVWIPWGLSGYILMVVAYALMKRLKWIKTRLIPQATPPVTQLANANWVYNPAQDADLRSAEDRTENKVRGEGSAPRWSERSPCSSALGWKRLGPTRLLLIEKKSVFFGNPPPAGVGGEAPPSVTLPCTTLPAVPTAEG